MARIDIIIPTYNRPAALPATLKSVQAQTFSDWRCFIAEDGETPETLAAVAPFLADHRFTYLPGPHAGRPAAPRNRAIRQGIAPFIAFLDDDDLWLPDKLARQIAFMEQHPACVLLGANAYIWNGQAPADKNLPLFFQAPVSGPVSFETLAARNIILNCAALVRRSVLSQSGLLNEAAALASVEDYELWLRIAPLGEVRILDAPLAIYRDTPQEGIRAGHTPQAIYRTLACAYAAALRGSAAVPSPLTYPGNRRLAQLCRNQRDFYLYHAGSFLAWRRAYFWVASEFRNARAKLEKLLQGNKPLRKNSDLSAG